MTGAQGSIHSPSVSLPLHHIRPDVVVNEPVSGLVGTGEHWKVVERHYQPFVGTDVEFAVEQGVVGPIVHHDTNLIAVSSAAVIK